MLVYREIWTIGDLNNGWLKESTQDALFDADEHTKQMAFKKTKELFENGEFSSSCCGAELWDATFSNGVILGRCADCKEMAGGLENE